MVNPLFNSIYSNKELKIFENAASEIIKNWGIDVIYIPRIRERFDDIFNEFTTSSFREHHTLEIYINELTGWNKKNLFLQEWGFGTDEETIVFTISKKIFQSVIPNEHLHNPGIPNEGDLIYIPQINHIFEITDVRDVQPFATAGSNYMWECEATIYISGGEKMPESLEDFKGLAQGINYNRLVSTVNKFPHGTSSEIIKSDTENISVDFDIPNEHIYGINSDSNIITSDTDSISSDSSPNTEDKLETIAVDNDDMDNIESTTEKEYIDSETKTDKNVFGEW